MNDPYELYCIDRRLFVKEESRCRQRRRGSRVSPTLAPKVNNNVNKKEHARPRIRTFDNECNKVISGAAAMGQYFIAVSATLKSSSICALVLVIGIAQRRGSAGCQDTRDSLLLPLRLEAGDLSLELSCGSLITLCALCDVICGASISPGDVVPRGEIRCSDQGTEIHSLPDHSTTVRLGRSAQIIANTAPQTTSLPSTSSTCAGSKHVASLHSYYPLCVPLCSLDLWVRLRQFLPTSLQGGCAYSVGRHHKTVVQSRRHQHDDTSRS